MKGYREMIDGESACEKLIDQKEICDTRMPVASENKTE